MTKQLDCVEDVNNFTKEEDITVLTNEGSLLFDRKGRFNFFTFECACKQELSSNNTLSKICENIAGVCMTMDTSIEKSMSVILSDGTVFKFNSCGSELYDYDMASTGDQNSSKTNATITPYSMLSTVTKNK